MVEQIPNGGSPHTGENLQGVFKEVKPFTERREWQPLGPMFVLVPARPETQVNPASAHLVDLSDSDGQRANMTERDWGNQGA
tara:strand:- start:349 stop:594 length:246 start_codon:yes stop_codon:yes gene_type:complete